MSRLFVVGDSFGTASSAWANWTAQAADQLGLELANYCLDGTSQDYAFRILIRASTEITRSDRIIVLLTSANRFWFQEQHPQVTNPALSGWSGYLDAGVDRAALDYVRYLQRPELDIQWTVQRLGWLAAWQQRASWAKPLIICCWPQHLHQAQDYTELSWARGDLVTVSRGELIPGTEITDWDPRYNHLCKVNHQILAHKVAAALVDDQPVDLTEGFDRAILDLTKIDVQQLDPDKLSLRPRQRFVKC